MKYKALMLDIDGTLIPYDYEALPSKRVTEAIKKVKDKIEICPVTGRSYAATKRLLKHLGIKKGHAIVDNGAMIIDIATDLPVYKQTINMKTLQKVMRVLDDENIIFYVKDLNTFLGKRDRFSPYTHKDEILEPTMLFTDETMLLNKIHAVLKKLNFPDITIYKTKHLDPNKYAFNITHAKATKLHGIEEIAKILRIKPKDMIGVGDGYNDFPLLMACGLKVAMGNAVKDLKEIADFVAPTVDDDGLAAVIEKYISK